MLNPALSRRLNVLLAAVVFAARPETTLVPPIPGVHRETRSLRFRAVGAARPPAARAAECVLRRQRRGARECPGLWDTPPWRTRPRARRPAASPPGPIGRR